ncbi:MULTISPECIES: hypothetical protein [Brevundimonas]|uniref:hypothetical protein n=1 Tax=Brevundimonas pishanensis TaxID=2896315 RepID=UPI001FA7BB94|nr:hypothetical protein [Brevundimonas pishanensis]
MPVADDAKCARCGRSHPDIQKCVEPVQLPMAEVIPFRARNATPAPRLTPDDPDGPSAA